MFTVYEFSNEVMMQSKTKPEWLSDEIQIFE